MEKINKLKQILVIDRVKQQELNLRSKRQCKELSLEEK
jgi:hypothetical protein